MMVVKKKNNSCMFIWLFVLIHQLKETSFGVEFLMISKMRIIFLYFIGAQSTMSEHFFFLFFFSPVCIVDIPSCIHCSYCSLSSVFFFSSSFLQIETYVSAIIHLFHWMLFEWREKKKQSLRTHGVFFEFSILFLCLHFISESFYLLFMVTSSLFVQYLNNNCTSYFDYKWCFSSFIFLLRIYSCSENCLLLI